MFVVEKDFFEKKSFIRTILNGMFIHPILNRLPAHTQPKVKKTHRDAEVVIDNKTTHKALEVLYRGGYDENSKTLKERIFRFVWMHTDNAKAVRNRLKLTEREIEKHIRYLYEKCDLRELRLLSIASGSARSFLEVIRKIEDLSDIKIHIVFLDKNPLALEYSRGLYASENFSQKRFSFEWVEGTANGYLRSLEEGDDFHVIEMVGLMDYFEDEKVKETATSIHKHLSNHGCFVTANIIPNNEQLFVTNVVGWRMIYRQPQEFERLIVSSAFSSQNVELFVEPMNVHTVIVARKD